MPAPQDYKLSGMEPSPSVYAIFDIGKTNKKFFLFDKGFTLLQKASRNFREIVDDDGYPSEDLAEIVVWARDMVKKAMENYNVQLVNFSTYGASLVNLDREGKLATPFYNYTKPIPQRMLHRFYKKYGGPEKFSRTTGSPRTENLLNSGLQLYWLKHCKPELYQKIACSLYLPQYFCFVFSGRMISEYTSLGCHTGMWDFDNDTYHRWLEDEDMGQIKLPITHATQTFKTTFNGKKITIGTGIHDSSASMIPYLWGSKKKFLLLSTGTWSIVLNPFYQRASGCGTEEGKRLYYMTVDGQRVKASKFFLGNAYKKQIRILNTHFNKPFGYHRSVKFDPEIYKSTSPDRIYFKFNEIELKRKPISETNLKPFSSFEEAYHQLMVELVKLQIRTIKDADPEDEISKIYIEGGFSNNDLFIKLLSIHLKDKKIRITNSPYGAALGAAMLASNQKIEEKFLKRNYKMLKPDYVNLLQ